MSLLRPAVKERLRSLDTFRGIAIAAMILVNNPGSASHVHPWLQHAVWNGCHLADFIFPFFLFIVGVAITLALGGRLERGGPRSAIVLKIVWRTAVIFALGIVLNGFPRFDWSEVRIPGVLQRIALCYLGASLVVLTTNLRGQAIVTAALLIAYAGLLKLVPVPGYGAGVLLPGKDLGAFFDSAVMPDHLLHQHWDPEGLLSTLGAVATTLSGVLVGHWLRIQRLSTEKVPTMLVAGTISIILGLAVSGWIPINKSLWTSSYVLLTSGVALNAFALCYWLIDVKGFKRWATPFVVYGTNPLIAYFGSSLMVKALLLWRIRPPDGPRIHLKRFIFERYFIPLASPSGASFLYALSYVLLWMVLLMLLYRRRIFIKI